MKKDFAVRDHKNHPADSMNWQELQQAIRVCRLCRLCESRTQAVFGEGAMNPPVMFIGEGPGCEEDRSGRPFVGRSGKLLDCMIRTMQLKREQVFISSIVKCRPPNNRNPKPDEGATCLPYLYRQIELLQPRILVLLGNVPLRFLLGLTGISKVHGNFYQCRDIPAVATYHPAYLMRTRSREKESWEDLRKVLWFLGKSPSQTFNGFLLNS